MIPLSSFGLCWLGKIKLASLENHQCLVPNEDSLHVMSRFRKAIATLGYI